MAIIGPMKNVVLTLWVIGRNEGGPTIYMYICNTYIYILCQFGWPADALATVRNQVEAIIG